MIGPDAGIRAADDLVHLSHAFAAGALRGWSTFQPGVIAQSIVANGEHVLDPTAGGAAGSFWYNADDGGLVYREVAGDFRAILDGHVRNSADSGLPPVTQFRIAGLAVHDPIRTRLNYEHIGFGSTAVADLRVEHKSTIEDTSDPGGGTSPGFSSISHPSGTGQLLLERVGDRFTKRVRSGPAGAWTVVLEFTRATPLPRTALQLGLIAYSNDATHDIELHTRSIVVSRP